MCGSAHHARRIIGFDAFTGFPEVHQYDKPVGVSEHMHMGTFQSSDNILGELRTLTAMHDHNRPLGHIPKIELVAGDATKTIPSFIKETPHLLVSLLYLDFDIYEPTKVALQEIIPRVVKGGVVAFDELNCAEFAGETRAFMEEMDLREVELRRFPMDPYISYFIR